MYTAFKDGECDGYKQIHQCFLMPNEEEWKEYNSNDSIREAVVSEYRIASGVKTKRKRNCVVALPGREPTKKAKSKSEGHKVKKRKPLIEGEEVWQTEWEDEYDTEYEYDTERDTERDTEYGTEDDTE